MRVSTTRTLLALSAAAALLGCSETAELPELTEVEVAAAERLFAGQGCTMCHGKSGEGGDAAPALRGLAPYWDVERLTDYLGDPDAFREANPDFADRNEALYALAMQDYGHLPEGDRRLLARWLMTR